MFCAIVAALTIASTSTAGYLVVTSKNIKNGTIQPIDLSAKAKRVMRGTRGPIGPPGERGPAGFSNLVSTDASTLVGSNTSAGVTALCSTGYKAVGGGFYASSSDVSVYISTPSNNGWLVRGFNSGTFSASLFAYALCASS